MSTRPSLGLEPAHTVVYVRDLDRMIEFYEQQLGFEVTDRGSIGEGEVAFLSQGVSHHQLAFVTGRTTEDGPHTIDHTAYHSSGSLEDLKSLYERLSADPAVTEIRAVTHGNTWSVYFRDPENNGLEVFVDTPWHVTQPQLRPLDVVRPVDEIVAWTRATFETEPGFEPAADFERRRRASLPSSPSSQPHIKGESS